MNFSFSTLFLPILLLTSIFWLSGCENKPVQPNQMVGRYKANLENATDTITLGEDNQFAEELRYQSGKTLLNHGEWALNENSIALKNAFGLDGGFPVSEGYLPTTLVVLPVQKSWGNVQSFGIEEFAVFVKER